MVYDGIDTEDKAKDIKRGCFRARGHNDHFPEPISVSAEVEGPDAEGKYLVRCKTFPRATGRKYVLDTYGSKEHLPYNPFAKLPRDPETGKAIYQ